MTILLPLAAFAAAAVPPAGRAAESPRQFVERVYARYARENYSPFQHPELLFAPALMHEIREDERLSSGEVGFLDADPLCQCQDAGGIHPSILYAAERARGTASVGVAIRFGDGPDRRELTLALVHLGAGWRIADIRTKEEPSLLADIRAFNARRARQRLHHRR